MCKQAERGFATSRLCVVTDEDGTILAHILHGSDWYIEKGGNALRAPDEMRDFYPPQDILLSKGMILKHDFSST